MGEYFHFGEKIKGYSVRVLNEREVRAGAGILFFFAIIAFMNSWLKGNFYYTKIFVIAFLIDFIIRVLINPRYSPSLILGRFIVSNQEVEYVGASQKRFAWALGLILAIIMLYVLVMKNIIGPVNLIICVTCLLLLFFETAFGICIGCKIYNLFPGKEAKLCPGGVCKPIKKENIQKINFVQMIIVLLFIVMIISIFFYYSIKTKTQVVNGDISTQNISNSSDCQAPDWAVAMGHGDLWKLHHGCS